MSNLLFAFTGMYVLIMGQVTGHYFLCKETGPYRQFMVSSSLYTEVGRYLEIVIYHCYCGAAGH